MQPVVRRQALGQLDVQLSRVRRGGQVARVQVDEDDVEQGPGAIVGVRELGQKLELLIRQVVGVREISAFPGGIAERLERERAQVGVPVKRPRLVPRTLLGEFERPLDPALDEIGIGLPLPDPPPADRLEGELRLHVRGGTADLDRLLHRLPEGVAVELERIRAADPLPELRLALWVALQLERRVEQRQALVDLVAAHSQLSRPPEPRQGLGAQPLRFVLASGPG